MTPEKYLLMYSKIWASIRHDIWKQIEEKKRESNVVNLVFNEREKIYQDAHKRFEEIRREIYASTMNEPEITPQQAKRNMQMCYASVASNPDKEGAEEQDLSLWPSQVLDVALKHNKLCNEIISGQYYPDIEKDPRK